MTNMKPCPFCGGTDIRYSLKASASICHRNYHACFYCWDCNTYGPRVLYTSDHNVHRYSVAENENIKQAAAEKWNSRI